MKKWRVFARVVLVALILGIFLAPGSPMGPGEAKAGGVAVPEIPAALIPALASSVGLVIYKIRSFFGL